MDLMGYHIGKEYDVAEGYLTGAKEQRKIDIDNAWQWLKDNQYEIELYGMDVCESDFRQAMEDIIRREEEQEYPKTYKECCDVLCLNTMDNDAQGYKGELIIRFQELLIARDAYWKIAGEEIGLGKPWKPINNSEICYGIFNWAGEIQHDTTAKWCFLTFPTKKMRDAFYENFKSEIENCKELL